MGDWDDSDEDDFAAAAPSPSAHDPFGGEDEDSDDGGNWDDSSEEEQEQEAPVQRDGAPGKSAKQLAREKKERQRKAATARLKAERMELAIRAGRTLVAAAGGGGGGGGAAASAAPEPAAADAASGAIGPVDADGVERRTDPSDGVGYTFAEFEEAYAERAQELWDLAGRIMLGESGTLGAVQQDSDMLFGGDDAGDGAGGDAPQDGPATLDSVLKYDLMSEQEFGAAADRLVNKFEQLIVSDNFVPFLGQWAVRAMQDAKADRVSELMSAPPCRRPVFATPLTRGRGQARSRGPRTPRRSWSAPPARRRRPPRRPPRRSRPPRRRLPQSPARRRRRTTPR